MIAGLKECLYCGRLKLPGRFVADPEATGGRKAICKSCEARERCRSGPPITMSKVDTNRNIAEAIVSGRIDQSYFGGRLTGMHACAICGMTHHHELGATGCCVPGPDIPLHLTAAEVTSIIGNAALVATAADGDDLCLTYPNDEEEETCTENG